jgi:hypothetical protein
MSATHTPQEIHPWQGAPRHTRSSQNALHRRSGYHEIVGLLGVRSHTSKKVSRFWPDTSS